MAACPICQHDRCSYKKALSDLEEYTMITFASPMRMRDIHKMVHLCEILIIEARAFAGQCRPEETHEVSDVSYFADRNANIYTKIADEFQRDMDTMFKESDVRLVMKELSANRYDAQDALIMSHGDVTEAIMILGAKLLS